MNSASLDKTMTLMQGAWIDALILAIEGEVFVLDNGLRAEQSAACLLQPAEGDRVLMYCGEAGQLFITQVLQQASQEQACLSVKGVKRLKIEQAEVSVLAQNEIRLTAVKNIDLSAIAGNLSVHADNIFSSVKDTVVEQAKHRISKAMTYALDVTGLTRMHSEQAVVTAEKDLKMDAERISMG